MLRREKDCLKLLFLLSFCQKNENSTPNMWRFLSPYVSESWLGNMPSRIPWRSRRIVSFSATNYSVFCWLNLFLMRSILDDVLLTLWNYKKSNLLLSKLLQFIVLFVPSPIFAQEEFKWHLSLYTSVSILPAIIMMRMTNEDLFLRYLYYSQLGCSVISIYFLLSSF